MAERAPTLRVTIEAYRAALNGDCEAAKRLYESNRGEAVKPFTVTNDNVLHIAVYSGSRSFVEELLEIVPDECVGKVNDKLNTSLHEAGVIGNVEVARVLVRRSVAELDARNVLGETPLFGSAIFGVTEMVKYLASELGRTGFLPMIFNVLDMTKPPFFIFWKDNILYFVYAETATWLLKNDRTLGDLKDQSGRTCLHLLARMPRAFKSGYPMGKLKGLFFFYLPNINEDDDKAQEPRYQNKDKRRKHELSLKLSKMLILRDTSWEETHTKPDLSMVIEEDEAGKGRAPKKSEAIIPASPTTPLLVATSTGIVEMVEEILKVGQNIMHVAIRHHRKEIFSLVTKMRIPMARLVCKIDDDGYNLLHHFHNYGGGTQPNPALQQYEELQWFEAPKNSSKEANWLKRTAESCSFIAVLIATAAFTAAYTVPGGSDDKTSLPLLLHNPFFLAFTVLDVVSLLTFGFTFLFLSVTFMMLAFSVTVLLLVHMEKRWSMLVVYAVAFVRVTAFVLLQFPLYASFVGILREYLSMMRMVLSRQLKNVHGPSYPGMSD
ncbi:hypothetical protein UlMin_011188 [Ulmus minor]